MAKKRRKLNKDFEKKIYSSKKNVELVLAKIYDIDDEDIQKEYMASFNKVVYLYDQLKENYQYQVSDPESDDKVIGQMTPKNGDDEWTHFEGDHFYKRYYFMPSTFNSMSMYRGNRWHSATFDA